MGRLIVQGIKFLATALVLYLLLFFALTHVRVGVNPLIYRTNDYYQSEGGVSYRKFKDWSDGEWYDLVVIGSSHAYRGYDPRIFEERGYRMFNMGSSAQTPLSTYAVLKKYVPKERAPLVVIDVFENSFDHAGTESVSDLIRNMDDDGAALGLAASFRDLRGLNMFTLRMMGKGFAAPWTDPSYSGRGAAISPDSTSADVRYPKYRPFKLNERQLDRFLACLDLCAERGQRVVLCSHFYPVQGERARHAEFKAMMDSVLAGRPERPLWIDFADAPGLDDHDHYCDHNHLNAAGARIFTDRLVDSLVAHGQLPAR